VTINQRPGQISRIKSGAAQPTTSYDATSSPSVATWTIPSDVAGVHHWPPPQIVRVHELAAEVHLTGGGSLLATWSIIASSR